MKSVSISDFSGGMQEASSPNDFTNRQWAKLKGIIPGDNTTFESQWAAQSFPTSATGVPAIPNCKLSQVYPLESSLGTFLVGIQEDGHIIYAKIPPPEAEQSVCNNIKWRYCATANYRFDNTGNSTPGYPNGTILQVAAPFPTPIPDRRFITPLPFEVYKYIKSPNPARSWDVSQDVLFGTVNTSNSVGYRAPASVCPGVLIGCRRARRGTTFAIYNSRLSGSSSTDVAINASRQAMHVAYVDPVDSETTWTGETYAAAVSSGYTGSLKDWEQTRQGTVKIVAFPHFRRWPVRTTTDFGTWPATTITYNGVPVSYSAATISKLMRVVRSTTETPTGVTQEFEGLFPNPSDSDNASGLKISEYFHPYTYKDANQTLLPGRGIIPRANVGTVWNNQLILGDIEWRSDQAATADNNGKAVVPASTAFVGSLNDDNTQPHRGSLYYGEDDIDVFDPRSVLRATSSDARIAGMHVIDNRLICITTAGSELDGVITFSGNLGQLHPYGANATPNPYAVRKQLVRGGVGVSDHTDDGAAYGRQTCLWSEAGIVVFVDNMGGVFYTDGQSCDRLDRYGPKQPNGSTHEDTVASVGKHLFVWRDRRLLCFSIVDSSNSTAQGCWTEVVAPPLAYTSQRGLYSMVGGSSALYMLVDGQVFRYAPASPHRGTIEGSTNYVDIEVATQTLGDLEGHNKTSWHRVGFSLFTDTTCYLDEVVVKGEAYLQSSIPAKATYTISPNNTYVTGHHDFVAPAGIGPQLAMSSYFKFRGNIVLKGFTAWSSSDLPSRTEPE
jgi:hypothetical protein